MKKRKEKKLDEYEIFLESQTEDDIIKINEFFNEIDPHLLINKKIKFAIIEDYKKALIYYNNHGVSLDESFKRLSPVQLGGFYTRPGRLWYPLDNSAKIYPISMNHGQMSVFRLSMILKEKVVPEILQMALTFTIKRFPSFATTVKKGFFWHYLDAAKIRYNIELDTGIPCQPIQVSRTNSKTFRLMYFDRRVSVEFFHILTDGSGGMTFLKTLIHTYFDLLGVKSDLSHGIFDISDVSIPENTANEFLHVPKSKNSSGFTDKRALQMSGAISRLKPHQVLHLTMDSSKLKEVSKSYQSTITTYLLSHMFKAMYHATDEQKGDFNIQVPVNMRKFYPSTTVRNFSMYCGIRLPLEKINDFESMNTEIANQLTQKASKESMSEMMTSSSNMVNSLKFIPLFIKQPIARIVFGFLGDLIFTNTLSNLGVVKLPQELSKHIEKMDFALGPSITNRAACSTVTFNNKTVFTMTKITNDPTFEMKFIESLEKDGLDVLVEGSYER